MRHTQEDLFAQDQTERNRPSDLRRSMMRSRLEATLARLEAAGTFPWDDPLDAVHEENLFQRDSEMLGEEGTALWARFDREMDRLYARQSAADVRAA